MKMGISAIVATYKRMDELERFLQSVSDAGFMPVEIIIVDQNTDNLIDDLVVRYSYLLPVVHVKITEANQSKARNIGLEHTTYPIVCFPDDDCWYNTDTLERVSDHFSNHSNTDLLLIKWKQKKIEGDHISRRLSKKDIFSYRAPVNYATYIQFYKKESFIKLGGFINHIGIGQYVGAGEDVEVIFKTAYHDMNIYYDSDIIVNHPYTVDVNRSVSVTRTRQRASGFMYAKYKLDFLTIARGFLSPLFKMILCGNFKHSKIHYHTFRARIEGYKYGKHHRSETALSH